MKDLRTSIEARMLGSDPQKCPVRGVVFAQPFEVCMSSSYSTLIQHLLFSIPGISKIGAALGLDRFRV